MLVQEQKRFEAVCESLGRAGRFGIDTEFIRERRYVPRLCLVQVRAGEGASLIEALIDPFKVSLEPLIELLEDENLEKIIHAGGQDLQIFFQLYGCVPRRFFDTQIAAEFLGYGEQPGYTDLVQRALEGPRLSKSSQYTDWDARPLSSEQLRYALADVQYLEPLYRKLSQELQTRGRLPWAEVEFRRAETRAITTLAPEELYTRLNLSGLNRRQLASLRELAMARDSIARESDRPPGTVLQDPAMLQMAKRPPASLAAFRSQRGVTGIALEYAPDFIAALKRAAALPPDQLPAAPAAGRGDPQTPAVVGLLSVVTQARAAEAGVARTHLAPRDQLTALADWWLGQNNQKDAEPPQMTLLSDWRRELLGNELLELLSGRVAIALEARKPGDSPDQPVVRLRRNG